MWVQNVLLLFRLKSSIGGIRIGDKKNVSFFQFMEIKKPRSGDEKGLMCLSLPCFTGDELHLTLDIANYIGHIKLCSGE